MNMMDWDVVAGRLVPYWLTVAFSLWILAFLYAWTCDKGYEAYNSGMVIPVSREGTIFVYLLHHSLTLIDFSGLN